MMDNFSKRLENLRDKHEYTKKEMSLKLGFTANVYGSYERGDRRPSLETIVKLADMFDVSLDYLIRGKEFQSQYISTVDIEELDRIIEHFHKTGIEEPYILQYEKWKLLNKQDLLELSNHFEWVVNKAKKN